MIEIHGSRLPTTHAFDSWLAAEEISDPIIGSGHTLA